jgi:hypothetical protein
MGTWIAQSVFPRNRRRHLATLTPGGAATVQRTWRSFNLAPCRSFFEWRKIALAVSRSALVAAVLGIMLVFVAQAGAQRSSFSGNVCGLLTKSELSSLHVTVTTCHPHATVNNSEGTIYDAVWGIDKPTGAPRLNLGIMKPANAAMLKLMKAHALKPDLGNGKTAANDQFVVGNYIVTINLQTPTNMPLGSIAPVLAVAKAVGSQLK